MNSSSTILYNSSVQPLPPILQDPHELVGTLESVEPVGDGLVMVRIARLERRVSDELEGRLGELVGKRTSISQVREVVVLEVP